MVSKEGANGGFWDDDDWDVLNSASKDKSSTAIRNDHDPPGWKVENHYGGNIHNRQFSTSIYGGQLQRQQQQHEQQSSIMSINADQQGYVSDLTLPSNRSLTTATTATVATDESSRSSLNGYLQSQRGMKNRLGPTPEVADAMSVPPAPLSPSMTKTPTSSASRRKSVMDLVKNILSPTAGSSRKRQERRRIRSSSNGAGRRFRPKATSNDKEERNNEGADDENNTQTITRSSSAGALRRFHYPSSLHEQQHYGDVKSNGDQLMDGTLTRSSSITNFQTTGVLTASSRPARRASIGNMQDTGAFAKSPRPARRASIGVTGYGVGVNSIGGPDPTLRDPVLARQRRKLLKEQNKSVRALVSSTPEPISYQQQLNPEMAPVDPTAGLAGNNNHGISNFQPLVEQDGAGRTKNQAVRPMTTISQLNDESEPHTNSRYGGHLSSGDSKRDFETDNLDGKRSSSVDAESRRLGCMKSDPPATSLSDTIKKKRRKEKNKKPASTRIRSSSRGRSRRTRSTSPTKFAHELSQQQSSATMRRSRSNGDIGSAVLNNPQHQNNEEVMSAETLIRNILDGKSATERSSSRGRSRRKRSTSPNLFPSTSLEREISHSKHHHAKSMMTLATDSKGDEQAFSSSREAFDSDIFPKVSSETKKLSKNKSIDTMIKQDAGYAKTTLVLNDEVTTTSHSRRSHRSSSRGASRDRRKRSNSISSTGSRRSKKKSDSNNSTRTRSSSNNRSRRKIRSSSPTLVPDGEESGQQLDGAPDQHSSKNMTRSMRYEGSAADKDGGDDDILDDDYPDVLKRQQSQKKLSGSSSKTQMMVRAKSMSRLNQSSSTQPVVSSMTSASKKDELRRSRSSSNLGRSSDSGSDAKPRRRRLKKQSVASTKNTSRMEKEEKGEEIDGNGSMNDWGYTSLSDIKRTEALHNSNDSSMHASMWSFSNAGDSKIAHEDWDVVKKSDKVPNATKAQNLGIAMDKKFNGAASKKLNLREQSSRSLSASRSRRERRGRNKDPIHEDADISTSTGRRARVKDALSRHGINASIGDDIALSMNETDPFISGEVGNLNRIPTIRRDNTTRAKGGIYDQEMDEAKSLARLPSVRRDYTI